MDGTSQTTEPPVPSFEVEDCELGYHFQAFFMLEELCSCLTAETKDIEDKLSVVHIALCFVGAVLQLLSLVVTTNLITKSSTAVLVSILLLYELLQLSAIGLLASFILADRRGAVQRVASSFWLLATWGVNYTLLDLTAEQILTALWPKLAQTYVTPLKALRRSGVVLVLGIMGSTAAFVQAAAGNRKLGLTEIPLTCEKGEFYYSYWKGYQTFVLTVYWLVPLVVLVFFFLVLLAHVLQTRVCKRHQYGHPTYVSHSTRRDIQREQVLAGWLAGWLALRLHPKDQHAVPGGVEAVAGPAVPAAHAGRALEPPEPGHAHDRGRLLGRPGDHAPVPPALAPLPRGRGQVLQLRPAATTRRVVQPIPLRPVHFFQLGLKASEEQLLQASTKEEPGLQLEIPLLPENSYIQTSPRSPWLQGELCKE